MDPMKQIPTASTAAKLLRISRGQVFKLIRQGKLRRGPVAKINHRWHTTVMIDAKFNTQREARGLKPIFPESKQPPRLVLYGREKKPFVPNLNPNLNLNPRLDPSPIQTVTPKQKSELTQAAMLERAENAMSICNMARNACQEIKDSITAYQHQVDTWAMEKVRTIKESELTCTRCTAILAAACILQILLAIYFSLCHFNII